MDVDKIHRLSTLTREIIEIAEELERDDPDFSSVRDLAESLLEEVELLADL